MVDEDRLVDEDEVRKIATLARIELEPGTVSALTDQVNDILKYIERLSSVDTKDIDPLFQVHGTENVFRDDGVRLGRTESRELQGTLELEESLANAPDRSGRYFKTPIVIE